MMFDFFAYFLTYLPTPVRFCPNIDFQSYYMVSDFGKSTYLPKNRTSFMDVPLCFHSIQQIKRRPLLCHTKKICLKYKARIAAQSVGVLWKTEITQGGTLRL